METVPVDSYRVFLLENAMADGQESGKTTLDGVPHYFRFHRKYHRVGSVFGNDWFALKAESFARFFGTPFFLVAQTIIVSVWIAINIYSPYRFDQYPFILLNLAFSLQAAYAAPLILLAQTRQADRDKALAEADAQHREALAQAIQQRQMDTAKHNEELTQLVRQNTIITEMVKELSQRIEVLTTEIHKTVVTK